MNKCLNCKKLTENNKYCSLGCQMAHQNPDRANKKYGKYKSFTVKCASCGKEFKVNEREQLFPKKEKYYCSRSCANRRIHSEETKKKISNSVKTYYKPYRHNDVEIKCKECGKVLIVKYRMGKQQFCSKSCSTKWKNKHIQMGHLGGIASAKSRVVRSKNEIYFSELCKKKFKKVLTNKSIFNGWDADVIVEDLKIAILWNGKWHYEKITKQHSVKQVQNRDKIKIKEIIKKGYIPYIIKDMGKANKKFVEKEFDKFIEFIKIKHSGVV